jgi:hypothetical protein
MVRILLCVAAGGMLVQLTGCLADAALRILGTFVVGQLVQALTGGSGA